MFMIHYYRFYYIRRCIKAENKVQQHQTAIQLFQKEITEKDSKHLKLIQEIEKLQKMYELILTKYRGFMLCSRDKLSDCNGLLL